MTADGAGGAIYCVALIDWVCAERIDAAGHQLWEYSSDGTSGVHEPQIISDRNGGAIIAWTDSRNGDADIYAQHVSSESGAPQWPSGGSAICTATLSQEDVQIVSDGSGGVILVWEDSRNGEGTDDVYAQRIGANGQPQWSVDGVAICTAPNGQYSPQIATDGSGGAIITWSDSRGEDTDVYAQRVTPSGETVWGENGIPISAEVGSQGYQQIVSDGHGGAVITWEDKRNISETEIDIFAQRVNGSGDLEWAVDGIPICQADDYQQIPRIVYDDGGEITIAWYHGYITPGSGAGDIYVQQVTLGGDLLCGAGGMEICTAAGTQNRQQLVSDGRGGTIVVWRDQRAGEENSDIYAARVDDCRAVPAILRSWSVEVVQSSIQIAWRVSAQNPGLDFSLLRSDWGEGGGFGLLDRVAVDLGSPSYVIEDTGCEPGHTYVYRLMATTDVGDLMLFESQPVFVPLARMALYPASPNPFNPSTTIRFLLPEATYATVVVYDLAGRLVRTLIADEKRAGEHQVMWNGDDMERHAVASGTYILSLHADGQRLNRRVMLLK